MAVRFILMMALVMVASVDPVPGQEIRVDIKQEVRAGGGCSTVDGVKQFGCLKLRKNITGHWEFKGVVDGCGNCTAGGEPYVRTFDEMADADLRHTYWTKATGKHVLTQKGLTNTPDYQVIGDFSKLHHKVRRDGSYLKDVIYKEIGLPDISLACDPMVKGGTWPDCTNIKVDPIIAPPGIIYLPSFTYEPYTDPSSLVVVNCKGFVGGQGLTVMLCVKGRAIKRWEELPWVYIYAPVSLQSKPPFSTGLYGLCNTFKGHTEFVYTGGPYPHGGSTGSSWIQCFQHLPPGDKYDIDITCGGFIESWKLL